MASHVYHDIFLHLNWHTKLDYPSLTGRLEELTYRAIQDKTARMKGVRFFGLGGTETHVHLAISIEPFVAISDLIQEIKGASAHEVNKQMGHKSLEWQRGYGVVSFGRRNLEWVLEYVANQREHHADGKVTPRLESCEGVAEKPG